MTSQTGIASNQWTGVEIAVELVNLFEYDLSHADPTRDDQDDRTHVRLEVILARHDSDEHHLDEGHSDAFAQLSTALQPVLEHILVGDLDSAADLTNRLLAEHPTQPHLSKDGGRWILHYHPADAEHVPMWHAICAEGFARLIGTEESSRVGRCRAERCQRWFFDQSKNGSRQYCGASCQNRSKTAAFRKRRAGQARRATMG